MISMTGASSGEAADRTGEHSVPLRYVIARLQNNRLNVLTLTAASRGEALPIFGSGQAAHNFIHLGGFGGGWRVRESTAGELISLLMGHLAGVDRVVLDPTPGLALSDVRLKSTRKEDFIAALMGEPLLISAR